jgi:phosphatidylglycerol---prolipoprotein diacylglyceryl transferase
VPVVHDPVAFELFGLPVRWYGLILLTAILVSIAIMGRLARRQGLDPDTLFDIAPTVVVAAVIGARVYYLLLRNDYYRANPDQLLTLQLQGLTIHGALAVGVAAFVLLMRRRGQPVLQWTDLVIAVVPIGQAIGRWGNWANQEAFGKPSTLPWAIEIDPARRPPEYASAATFHPTFLYESILNLLAGAILIWLLFRIPSSPRLRHGDVLGTYMILYGIIRLVVERLRTDSLTIGPWPAAYWLSGALIVAGLLVLVGLRKGPFVQQRGV